MSKLIDADALKREFNLSFGSVSHAAIAAQIIDAAPTIDPVKHGRWISVNDRLSEPETEVLVVSPGWGNRLIYIGELRHMAEEKSWMTGIVTKESDWCIWGWSYLKKPNVTHWMPMPEPPTGAMNTDE